MRQELAERWKELTERVLPERGRVERWPLRLDHCFKRVCLDWAYGGVWYEFCRRPAERHMSDEAMGRAVRCAEEILEGGVEVLQRHNEQSLRWRGKRVGATSATGCTSEDRGTGRDDGGGA